MRLPFERSCYSRYLRGRSAPAHFRPRRGGPVRTWLARWIDASRYDVSGNQVWSLSPGNRLQALTPTSDTDPYVASRVDSAERADLLATTSAYSDDGVDLLATEGPAHPVVLDSGATASARQRTSYTYDQGAPAGGPYHLVTTTTLGPDVLDGTPTTAADTRTTRTGYDPIVSGDPSGWSLFAPTSQTTVMGSGQTDIVSRTRYDAAGRVVETRMPASSGTDAGTTVTIYYTAAANSSYPSCGGKPQWAGLVCQTGPKVLPAGVPIPTTTSTYTFWSRPDAVTDTAVGSSGTTTRTTTTNYDPAGRPTKTTVTGAQAGNAVPDVSTGYDGATGLPTTVSTSSVVITTGYDSLGRVTSYTDADGNTTRTGYTVDGNVATVDDGRAVTRYTYDGTDAAGRTERRGLPTRVDAGMGAAPSVFTGAYDADGNLTSQTYPNGLVAATGYDNNGDATDRAYGKGGASWLEFTATSSVEGQVRAAAGPGNGGQSYRYDPAGRLTRVEDTYGGGCHTRLYDFDPALGAAGLNSDRLRSRDYPDSGDGVCTTGTTAITQSHSYDSADRITDSGYSYDRLGRTLTVPAAQVTGGADLTVTYYANDMVASLVQGGEKKTFTLDPAGRLRTATDSGGPSSGTITNHYRDPSDSPAWIAEADGGWTRNVETLSGDLGAIQAGTGSVLLQLTNLHGDVVATAADDATATGPTGYFEQTEFGIPRPDNTVNPVRYGWLGSKQRSADSVAGVILMGVRLYNPTTGRFLQVDPVPRGSATAYDYCRADPLNCTDLVGQSSLPGGLLKGIYKFWSAVIGLMNAHKTIAAAIYVIARYIQAVKLFFYWENVAADDYSPSTFDRADFWYRQKQYFEPRLHAAVTKAGVNYLKLVYSLAGRFFL